MSGSCRPGPAPAPGRRTAGGRGFTLVEVLVALGIVAIALTAGLQATAALTRNAQRQIDNTLAQLCAENALTKIRLGQQLPSVGDTEISCEQGNRSYRVNLAVRPTPNPNFRRVEARVLAAETPVLSLFTLVGRL